MSKLTQEQATAAHYDGKAGNVLVLAGAGCGKTTVLMERIKYLVRKGTHPSRILLLTFTNRSADDMRERLTHTIGDAAASVVAANIHRFCQLIMRSLPDIFGNTHVIDDDDQRVLMTQVCALNGVASSARDMIAWWSLARNTMTHPRTYLKDRVPDDTIAAHLAALRQYQQHKKERGYLDFDDILVRTYHVLKNRIDITQKLMGRFDTVLVDEAQDLNRLQWRIITAVSSVTSLMAVGDDAQSIYGFRGADFNAIHTFTRLPNSTVLKLTTNFRSGQEILDVSNWLLSQSEIDYGKQLRAFRGAGKTPVKVSFPDDVQEAEWVASDILSHQRPQDHLVLVRGATHAKTLETVFLRMQVPYRMSGGASFLSLAHVRDTLAAVRAVTNVRDDIAWIRFLRMWPGVGAARARSCMAHVRNHGPAGVAVLETPQLSKLVAHLTVRASPSIMISRAVEGLTPLFSDKYRKDWQRRATDLDTLIKAASKYKSVHQFISFMTMESPREHGDVVTVSTVHSAKGTEAPYVYLLRAQDGVFPHKRCAQHELEEERRVLYVALTRAQDTLVVTRVMKDWQSDGFLAGADHLFTYPDDDISGLDE